MAKQTSTRRRAVAVRVGDVEIGGDAPIVVQSMTNTDTADVVGTVAQSAALARAGSDCTDYSRPAGSGEGRAVYP